MSFLFSPGWFAEREAARREREEREEREAAEQRQERAEAVKDVARRAEERFKPLGATFTAWVRTAGSTPDWPKLQAFLNLPNSGLLYRVTAEPDGYTLDRL